MTDLWQDVRYGARVLVRARGFTVVAVVLLGLGIGAATTIFSAINGVLRRPLPYDEPARLVALWESNPGQQVERAGVAAPRFVALQQQSRALDGLAAYRHWGFVLTGSGEPERVLGARVSANLFSVLGVRALHGRTLLAEEGGAGQPNVVLVSEELWRRRFGADAGLVGRDLRLDGQRYAVVGVVPAGFELPKAELWVPLVFAPYELDQRGARTLSVVARLKAGAGIATAREDVSAIGRALAQQYPEADAGWDFAIAPLQDSVVGDTGTPLALLFAATCAVLLVACANLANLILARSTARRREIALRAALGAGRSRIVRQLVTESMLTVAAAAALGLALAVVGTHLLAGLGPTFLPRSGEIGIDGYVLAFVLIVSLVTGVGLAAIPAFDASKLNLVDAIKTGSADRPGGRAAVELRDLLVIGQVALALLLLVGGGLLVRSFIRARSVDLGFSSEQVLSMTVSLPDARYPQAPERAAFFDELVRRVEVLPGVRSAGLASHLPLAGGVLSSDVTIEGRPPLSSADVPRADLIDVGAAYFRTMNIRIVQGRAFAETDRADGRPVAIVDETLARRFWPSGDALGRRVRLGATLGADTAWREIVGVVSSVRSASVVQEPAPTIYVPHAQNPWPTMSLVIKTAGDPWSFAKVAAAQALALDAGQPVHNVRSLEQVVVRTLAFRRLQTLLLGGFAATALLLATIGVYGMLAYAVARRIRELGIRVALGAGRRDVLLDVLGRALGRIAAGLVIGGAVAAAGSRLLASVLFQVSPLDPITFGGAVALVAIAGLGASALPAWRAATVDPMLALRRD